MLFSVASNASAGGSEAQLAGAGVAVEEETVLEDLLADLG